MVNVELKDVRFRCYCGEEHEIEGVSIEEYDHRVNSVCYECGRTLFKSRPCADKCPMFPEGDCDVCPFGVKESVIIKKGKK